MKRSDPWLLEIERFGSQGSFLFVFGGFTEAFFCCILKARKIEEAFI